MTTNFRFSSVTEMLKKQGESLSDRVCLLYPDQADPRQYASLTYAQLDQLTDHLRDKFATQIDQSSGGQTPVVCLLGKNNTSYLLSIYALFKMNVVIFPLSPRNNEEAIIHLFEKCNVSYLFYSEAFSSMVKSIQTKLTSTVTFNLLEEIHIDELLRSEKSTSQSTSAKDELEQIRMIFHSSGSTSLPKPIRLSTRCLFGWYEACAEEHNNLALTSDDILLAMLPLFHIAGMSTSMIMWYVGGVCAMPLAASFPPTPKELFSNLQSSPINKLVAVPLTLEELIPLLREDNNNGFRALARLKLVIFIGATCPADVCSEIVDNGVKLVSMYGSTEMGFVCTSDYDTNEANAWQKIRPFRPRQSNIQFVAGEHDSNICELIVKSTDPFLSPDFASGDLYSSGDLFLEDPPASGYYTIQGRNDDLLVHTTGEKTNPLPIEMTIREHSIVKHAVVIGHQRPCCSVLIQLNTEEAFKHELRSIEKQVFDAVNAANKTTLTHSHIVPSLVYILPLGKKLPITGKGNVVRKQVNLEFRTVIDRMYHEFSSGSSTNTDDYHRSQKDRWTKATLRSFLQMTIGRIVNKPMETLADYSKSFYSLSLDSLTAVELRNRLCRQFGPLEQNLLYEFSSIDALADELLRIVHKEQIQTSSDAQHYEETEQIIDAYIARMNTDTSKPSNHYPTDAETKRVVLITGANGSLGSQLFLQLSKQSQVSRVYCLVRGENPLDRLREAMQRREQDSSVLLDEARIVVLPMDLNDEKLGQTETMYNQLHDEVTDIIHSAWKMDFNMTIKDFDRECLQGLYRLLQFASHLTKQESRRFHFVSSISAAGSGLLDEVQEEPLPRRAKVALAQGYGQSKYAAEHLCFAAMERWGVPVDAYRLGQISGDSETGVWNTSEMIPLMICAGGGELGVLPKDCQRVDWIPVNYAAACLVDIAMNSSAEATQPSERVHHILNPHAITWSQLLDHLKCSGLEFDTVSIQNWLRLLLASPENPACALAGFFEKVFAEGKTLEFAQFKMEKTIARTTILQHCPPIDQALVQRYLNQWQQVGFLKHGYTSSV